MDTDRYTSKKLPSFKHLKQSKTLHNIRQEIQLCYISRLQWNCQDQEEIITGFFSSQKIMWLILSCLSVHVLNWVNHPNFLWKISNLTFISIFFTLKLLKLFANDCFSVQSIKRCHKLRWPKWSLDGRWDWTTASKWSLLKCLILNSNVSWIVTGYLKIIETLS